MIIKIKRVEQKILDGEPQHFCFIDERLPLLLVVVSAAAVFDTDAISGGQLAGVSRVARAVGHVAQAELGAVVGGQAGSAFGLAR